MLDNKTSCCFLHVKSESAQPFSLIENKWLLILQVEIFIFFEISKNILRFFASFGQHDAWQWT